MEELRVSPEEVVIVPVRNNKGIRVTQNMYDALRVLRGHLIDAARSKSTITYGEASALTDGAYLPQGWGPALDVLSEDCFRRDEPSLAALVVRGNDGQVGDAFVGDAETEREACFEYWKRF